MRIKCKEGRIVPSVAIALALAFAACVSATSDALLRGKTCTAGGECAPGYECDLATRICVPPAAKQPAADLTTNGAPCSEAHQCASGHCTDGVCCDSACDGSCEACSLKGERGTCTALHNGDDPENECPADSACDGHGSCEGTSLGADCNEGADCASGYCAENVCCATPCAGACRSCLGQFNGSGADGQCGFIDQGYDPYQDCDGPKNCNGEGGCL